MSSSPQRSKSPTRGLAASLLGRSGYGVVVALLLFTALIWLRLRLTTDVPRQAYAEPRTQQQQQRASDVPAP